MIETLILSSLTKVFENTKPDGKQIGFISMFKNERVSFQIAIKSDIVCNAFVEVNGFEGKTDIYKVENVPVGLASFENTDDYYLKKESGSYPDLLTPYDDNVYLKKDKWYSFWAELSADNASAGTNELFVLINDDLNNTVTKSITVEIIDGYLPDVDFVYTNWYHCDAISQYYNVPVFSDKFWRINRNYISTAVSHGMNCILTPLFTPPLDTAVGKERLTVQLVGVTLRGGKYVFDFRNLKKWIDMCRECGIKYFEISHLFTQWGALHAPKVIAKDSKGRFKKIFGWETKTSSEKYDNFILQLGEKLVPFLEKEGIKDRCFFHISDEPSEKHISIYKKRAELINKAFPGFKTIDALSDIEFYKTGSVKQPIPETGSAEKFYGLVDDLWVYYCCGQGDRYLSNRFIAMPSQRTRVLGYQLYKYDVKGFLQWGYNFYNTAFSLKQINPYEVTDAGGSFPSGDSFTVYPGNDGKAYPSLRLKVFYDALQDFKALKLLESCIGRNKTIEILEEGLEKHLSFTDYPHSIEWHLNLREKINSAIKLNLEKSGS